MLLMLNFQQQQAWYIANPIETLLLLMGYSAIFDGCTSSDVV